MSVSQNDALFSLLGTIYGGDGRTTFGLPDLRGRIPIHPGTGPGLSARKLGAKAGAENVTLTTQQLGQHSHTFEAVSTNATASAPTTSSTLAASVGYDLYVPNGSVTAMASQAMAVSGGGGLSGRSVRLRFTTAAWLFCRIRKADKYDLPLTGKDWLASGRH